MTRQRFARADQADSDCVPADDANKPLLSTQTGGDETVTATIAAQTMNQLAFSFTMEAGDPGGAEDLDASSLFTSRLDVSAAGASLSYSVEFHGLNATCTSQGSVAMGEGDFTGAGTKTATATWNPPISDRYQVRVIVSTSEGHNGAAQDITIRTNNSITDLVIPDAPGGVADYPPIDRSVIISP